MRHIMRLTQETFVRSRALKEVLEAIDMPRQVAGSLKQQDTLHALSTFMHHATSMPISNKAQMKVVALFPVN